MYDQQMQLFITYDDPTSAQSKALYASSRGLAGVATFDVSGDDDSFSLVNAIRNGLGLS
jgi:GH18 family chitinase